MPPIGRDAELAVLEEILEDVCGGACRFVGIMGEPGIGKSTVLAELIRRAKGRGCLALDGRATELERELPFGLLVDAFDAHLAGLDPRIYERLAADGLHELGAVFPSLRSLGPDASYPVSAAERFRAHHAVRELIERLAARQPVVLVLDDLHWSDGASLELMGYLLRRRPEGALLLAAAFRTGRMSRAFMAAHDEAVREGAVTEIELGPLAPDEAAALLNGQGWDERDQLYRASGGNPFYLLQLARGAGETRAPSVSPDPDGVPATVRAAIAAELDALAPQVREFAQAAAVAGDPFDLDVAVAVAAHDEDDALAALDALVAGDLVRAAAEPRSFRFRHPLVRSAIYAASPAGSRLRAHRRAAEALAQRGAPAVVRAHHVEQSARHGDADAIATLREAGEDAAQRAPATAVRWFGAALRILPASAPPGDRAGLLTDLATGQAAIGRLEESRESLLAALPLVGAEHAIPLISACASTEHLLGRHEEATGRLQAAIDARPGSLAEAALKVDLGHSAFFLRDYDGMRAWAAEAVEDARSLDDRPLLAAALALLTLAESCVGPVADAQEHVEEAAALIDAMPDEDLAQRLIAVAHLTGAEFYLERYAEAIAHGQRGITVARATGQGHFWPLMIQALGNVLFSTGRLDEAKRVLDESVDSARLSDNEVGLGWTLLNRAYASVIAGEIEDGLRYGSEAVDITREHTKSSITTWAGAVHAFALLEAGDAQGAADLLVASGGGPGASLIPGAWRANWLEVLTRCYLALGRRDDARAAADASVARAEMFGLRLCRAAAERALGAVALADGDAQRAAEHALLSAAFAEEVGAPLEAAHSRTLAGRALAAAGDTERAVAELEQAAATFDRHATVRYRDRAERELRALGRVVYRRTRPGTADATGLDSLTGRELEIARLVVDRRTNPEIAAELFLSIKTVETHLRNVFRKLGASSRVEVARMVESAEPAK